MDGIEGMCIHAFIVALACIRVANLLVCCMFYYIIIYENAWDNYVHQCIYLKIELHGQVSFSRCTFLYQCVPYTNSSPLTCTRAVLEPYKYAGYPMLIKTIGMESTDDDLFSKSAPILTAASEVAFHTMNTSALNAEELQREDGIVVRDSPLIRQYSVLNILGFSRLKGLQN